MPDAAGNIKGIALGGKAAEAWERIFGKGRPDAPPADEGAMPSDGDGIHCQQVAA